MTADIHTQKGYVVLSHGTSAAGADSRGYAMLASGASVPASAAYVMLSNPASVLASPSYVMIANPASVPASASYALITNPASVVAAPGYVIIAPFYPPYSDVQIVVDFVEERFPECVSFGSSGGPGFKTSVFEFDSGFTASTIEWERIRARYDVTFENATPADIEEVEDFFYGVRGRAVGFRYKDWTDYQISQQNVLVGDGTTNRFQIFKRYVSGSNIFDRVIKKPVRNTIDMTLNGAPITENGEFFVNYSKGEIVFRTPPPPGAIGTITYLEFDVPVRFDTDQLSVSYDDFQQLNVNSLPLVELLV